MNKKQMSDWVESTLAELKMVLETAIDANNDESIHPWDLLLTTCEYMYKRDMAMSIIANVFMIKDNLTEEQAIKKTEDQLKNLTNKDVLYLGEKMLLENFELLQDKLGDNPEQNVLPFKKKDPSYH